jgi:methyl-accepting chemotaxis protein
MKWFYNLKISKKLLISYSVVVGLMIFLGILSLMQLKDVKTCSDDLAFNWMPSIRILAKINDNVNTFRAQELEHVIMQTPEQMSSVEADMNNTIEELKKNEKTYEPLISSEHEKELYNNFIKSWDDYLAINKKVISVSRQNQTEQARAILIGESKQNYIKTTSILDEDIALNDAGGVASSKTANNTYSAASTWIIGLLIIGIVLALFIALFISKYLSKSISLISNRIESLLNICITNLTKGSEQLADGDLNIKMDIGTKPLEISSKDEIGILAGNINLVISRTQSSIASVEKAVEVIKDTINESNQLAIAATEGKLATRGNATKYKGSYKELVNGINNTLDAIIGPLNVAAEYVDRIAKGDIPNKITDNYNGDFNEIKNNLNVCIDAINALVFDASVLSKAAVEGKLATRADAAKHQGDFRKIVQGVNETLDSVIGPLNVAAEYVDRIAKGDIPNKITDTYNGDFNEIKNNLNVCIDAVNALVADAAMLTKASVEGKLATRADASKHQGDYRKIVQGFNETLDAVIGPLNVAAEYVDRISKGDIPNKIIDNYNGDFNEIKNNLNNCVDIMNNLLKEAGQVITAAADGELSKRANADLFVGGWKTLVAGINEIITNIVNPLMVTADYVDKVSKGVIPPQITDTYKGQYNVIKNNLNAVVKMMSELLAETDKIIKAAADGDLDKRANADLFAGGWNTLVAGVNDTITNIVNPLMVTADYVEKVSKGVIPPQITDIYKGQYNIIKNNLNAVVKMMSELLAETDKITKAAAEGDLDKRADASLFVGGWNTLVVGVNDTITNIVNPLMVTADYVEKVSKGVIPPQITDIYKGQYNIIKNNLNGVVKMMSELLAETDKIIKAAADGDLDKRANADLFVGGWNTLVAGVNDTITNIVNPLMVTANYVDKISKGEIPAKITDVYKGQYNIIKSNLNMCIEAVNALVDDASVLSKAAIEGKLATRADASKHQGDFRKVVQGVNETLDSVIGPLNVAAEYVDRIAKGDIPNKITDNYNGDFNEIKNNLNVCIDAINALVFDASVLSKAAVEGKLATRADAAKHQGDFRKIVQGVNETLDSVIGPLNVAAEYVDRIAKGDIPNKITDTYNGDFNEIKNNLNVCIDAVNALVADAAMLTKASVEGKLATRADASKHQGDYRKIVQGVNETLDSVIGPLNVAAEYVDRIAKGDIPNKITDNYNGDFNEIKNNLNVCIDAVNALVADAAMLTKASVEGKLATRADASKHQGDYRKIVQGVNETLDAVIGPLNVAAEYVDRIAKGDIPNKITDNYNGDFNEIKNNLNVCIDAITALVFDASVLSKAAVEGKLATRADASKHQGDYRKIVQGVNETLDAVIGPLNVAAEYVDRIAKGDIPNKITDNYNGDFNEIKNNLNVCIDAINALVFDASVLSKAAVEGKLATRADAAKHQGDYRKIVQGVNETLDSVIGPLNVAAEYVDRIAKGDIPNKITDNYNGDFNEIKNNLNVCIDAVNALVADAAMLTKASVEGKLATRADASKHQGDYRKIVQGVNETLDAVIGPLNVAAEYVDRISKGDIPNKIVDNYNGDFNEIKNNLNNCVDIMNNLLKEAGQVITAAADGELSKRANADLFVGGWKTLVAGINEIITNIVNPLMVTADYVDKVSKGVIPPQITDTYKGQYNVIKNNLNAVVKMMSELLAETDKIIKAAADGDLDKRANADLFAGGWNTLVAGVNDTITNIVNPLMVTADYVEKISKGNIPAKITDIYKGQYNIIKSNLNMCIEAVNSLVDDASLLSKAAVDGKLAVRADASKHQGDFRKIVQGVNETLDSVIGPLNVAAEYVDRIAKGDIPNKISDNYNGDFNEIKNNLNVLIDSMNEITSVAEQIATGNLQVSAKERSGQDKLMRALSSMINGLTDVVENVKNSADSVSTGSKELSIGSTKISEGANKQAAAAEEASSSMEQMSSNIKQNAENAVQTEKIALQSAQNAEIGGKAVSETVSAMKEIAGKISIIEEIARQTNLLALNAAIEAARAGEHGKGFAVVASEVRKLAERSQTAAAEINKLSATSVEVAENAGEMLAKLVPDIKKTAELVQEISAASNEQNAGAAQINKAIQQLDQVIQQNVTASEELTSTAMSFTSQSEQLQSVMGFFTTDDSSKKSAQKKQSALKGGNGNGGNGNGNGGYSGKTVSTASVAKGYKLNLDSVADHSDSEFEKF